jgi:bacteriorhodopsin
MTGKNKNKDKSVSGSKVNKSVQYITISYLFTLVLGLGITSLVLSVNYNIMCNNVDVSGVNITRYMYGYGISQIISFVILSFISRCGKVNTKEEDKASVFSTSRMAMILLILFNVCWFIVGGLVILRSNLECLTIENPVNLYVIISWCLFGIQIVISSFMVRQHTKLSKDSFCCCCCRCFKCCFCGCCGCCDDDDLGIDDIV